MPIPPGQEPFLAIIAMVYPRLPASKAARARFVRISELIAAVGLDHVGAPHVRHLTGPLWEMRMRGRGSVSRALYVTVREQRVVVVRAFVKKTQRTPRREIELALQRAKEVLG